MYEGIPNRRLKPESLRKKKSSVLGGLKYALAGAIGLGGLPHAVLAIDKIGVEKFELQDSYEKTLKRAKEEYDAKVRSGDPTILGEKGVVIDFARFLEAKNIPTQDEVTGLKRLIAEFNEPVQMYKGEGLIAHAVETEFGKKESFGAASYRDNYYGDGHELYLHPEIHEKDPAKREEEEKYFTRVDIEYIVSELAHATQDEQGKKKRWIQMRPRTFCWQIVTTHTKLQGTLSTRHIPSSSRFSNSACASSVIRFAKKT